MKITGMLQFIREKGKWRKAGEVLFKLPLQAKIASKAPDLLGPYQVSNRNKASTKANANVQPLMFYGIFQHI